MTAIPPLAFHAQSVFLRTWFAAEPRGPFEQLEPDVEIHALDLAHFDTGDMIVVDDDGGGDFRDLQKAVNMAAGSPEFDAVLVMPGRYVLSEPLSVSGGRRVEVCGVGREWVQIENAEGVALVPFSGVIENVTVTGVPAMDDAAAEAAYDLTIRRCKFRGGEGSAAAVQLGRRGSVKVYEVEFDGGAGRHALRLSGITGFSAQQCMFSGGEAGSGLVLQNSGADALIQLLNSRLYGSPAILLAGEAGTAVPAAEVYGCILTGAGGKTAVSLAEGKTGGAIRIIDSVLSAEVGANVTLAPPTKQLPHGNVIVPLR
jgi:hypothetical protein